MESNILVAREEIDRLIKAIENLPEDMLDRPVRASFILLAEGEEQAFQSTIGRELGFCTHHAIHHNALIKTIATTLAIDKLLAKDFGLAPSTANYNLTHGS